MVKPECFVLGLMQTGKWWGQDRTEGLWLSAGNWGSLARPVRSVLSRPSIFGDDGAPSFGVQGGHLSQEGLMTCFRGEG